MCLQIPAVRFFTRHLLGGERRVSFDLLVARDLRLNAPSGDIQKPHTSTAHLVQCCYSTTYLTNIGLSWRFLFSGMLRRVVWCMFAQGLKAYLIVLMNETVSVSKTSVIIYQKTRRNIPERWSEKLKCQHWLVFHKNNEIYYVDYNGIWFW